MYLVCFVSTTFKGVETGPYCSCVSVALRSHNFTAKVNAWPYNQYFQLCQHPLQEYWKFLYLHMEKELALIFFVHMRMFSRTEVIKNSSFCKFCSLLHSVTKWNSVSTLLHICQTPLWRQVWVRDILSSENNTYKIITFIYRMYKLRCIFYITLKSPLLLFLCHSSIHIHNHSDSQVIKHSWAFLMLVTYIIKLIDI